MTRKELIEKLRERGIEHIWGRGLTTRTKTELQEYLNHVSQGERQRHLSYSQISQFQLCALQYYFKRVDPKAPKFPMPGRVQLGRAYDRAVSAGLEEKKQSGAEPNGSMMSDVFAETFKDCQDVAFVEDEQAYYEAQGIEMVHLYRQVMVPSISPIQVQESYNVRFNNRDYQLMVVPDLEGEIANEIVVVDHKTGQKTPTDFEADNSDQLTAYAMAHQARTGKLPDKVSIHRAIAMRRGPKDKTKLVDLRQTGQGVVGIANIESKRKPEQIQRYLKTMEITVQQIAQGIYPPARTGTWPCLPGACDYWDYCHTQF